MTDKRASVESVMHCADKLARACADFSAGAVSGLSSILPLRDDRKECRAALRSEVTRLAGQSPDEGWRDIATAPDETPIWLADADGFVWIGERCFEGDGWLWGNCYLSVYPKVDKTWGSSDCQIDDDYQPIYWQPLPSLALPSAPTKKD